MKSSSLFRMTAVAAALCLAAGTASANTTTITLNSNGYASFGDSVSTAKGVSFSDIFDFTMPSAATGGSSSTISIIANGINFTNFALMQGLNTIVSGSGLGAVYLNNFTLTKGLNPYSLVVEGKTTVANSNAGYSGSIRVSPVPEPKTYAMLLAGLGLLAFTARRRHTSFF
jgi:hypothetical protein